MPELNVENRTMFTNDNLDVLRGINSECIDLIYLDPPFNTGKHWQAPLDSSAAGAVFDDVWALDEMKEEWVAQIEASDPAIWAVVTAAGRAYGESMQAYLTFMCVRLFEMHRILKPTGSLYLHCDPTASHYLKPLLDAVFGPLTFRNELIWHYRGAALSSARNIYPRKHDTLLFYSRGNRWTFHQPREVDISEQMINRWGRYLEDDGQTVLYGSIKHERVEAQRSRTRIIRALGREPRDDDVAFTVNPSLVRSVWTDIPEVRNSPRYNESVGYPTQKPLALLERIIEASSNPGDVVLDPFCGCATACIAAEKLNRQWIGIDISDVAWQLVNRRMRETPGVGIFGGQHRTDVPVRTDQPTASVSPDIRERLYATQGGQCAGCGDAMRIRNLELDHITPRSKGGLHRDDNLQLLCGWCNRTKGPRDMNYLRVRLRELDG